MPQIMLSSIALLTFSARIPAISFQSSSQNKMAGGRANKNPSAIVSSNFVVTDFFIISEE